MQAQLGEEELALVDQKACLDDVLLHGVENLVES